MNLYGMKLYRMHLYGLVWTRMDSYGMKSNEMYLYYGLVWNRMVSYGNVWTPMETYRLVRNEIALNVLAWTRTILVLALYSYTRIYPYKGTGTHMDLSRNARTRME